MTQLILVQRWTETESGWGQRPDGYSLHLNETDRQKYLKADQATKTGPVPAEYSFADGEPYLAVATADQVAALTDPKAKAAGGIRSYDRSLPAPAQPGAYK